MDFFLLLVLFFSLAAGLTMVGLMSWTVIEDYILGKSDPLVAKTPHKKNKPIIRDEKHAELLEPLGYKLLTQDRAYIRMTDGKRPINQKIFLSQIKCKNAFQACFGKTSPVFDLVYDTKDVIEEKIEKDLGKFHQNRAEYFKSFEEERVDKRVEDAVKLTKARHEQKEQTRMA